MWVYDEEALPDAYEAAPASNKGGGAAYCEGGTYGGGYGRGGGRTLDLLKATPSQVIAHFTKAENKAVSETTNTFMEGKLKARAAFAKGFAALEASSSFSYSSSPHSSSSATLLSSPAAASQSAAAAAAPAASPLILGSYVPTSSGPPSCRPSAPRRSALPRKTRAASPRTPLRETRPLSTAPRRPSSGTLGRCTPPPTQSRPRPSSCGSGSSSRAAGLRR